MNKKMLLSFLLSLGICSFSAKAMESALSVETLPLLAQCIIDEDNNVQQILKIKHLGPEEIRQLAALLEQGDDQGNHVSLHDALTKFVSGTKDILEGVSIVVIIGGRYIVPRVVNLTKEAWSSLLQKYDEYIEYLDALEPEEIYASDYDDED